MQVLMVVGFFLFILFLIGDKERKHIYGVAIMMVASAYFFPYQYLYLNYEFDYNKSLAFLALSASLIMLYFYKKHIKEKTELIADRVSVWDIEEDEIRERFAHRIVKKVGRNEIKDPRDKKVHFFKKTLLGDKELYPFIWEYVKDYRYFNKIESLKYFDSKASRLEKKIYKKMQKVNKKNELGLEFNRILAENGFIVEFFLMDIWERIVSRDILGVATLNVIAKSKRELCLIDALDALVSENLQKDAVGLLAHYFNYKNRI
jgi:hypothetical protein